MGLVSNGFKEIGIALHPANIFWRAGPSTLQAKGVFHLRVNPYNALEKNFVFPGVTEVVLVLKPELLTSLRQNIADFRGRGVLIPELLEIFLHQHRVGVLLLPDFESVQVRIRPAHRRLDVFVQLVERAILHLNTSPVVFRRGFRPDGGQGGQHPRCRPRGSWRSWLPPSLLERLAGVTTGFLLLFPQLEELALLPAPLVFRRPLAHHILVFARLDHLTGDFGTDD
jgi:hypothetical protein